MGGGACGYDVGRVGGGVKLGRKEIDEGVMSKADLRLNTAGGARMSALKSVKV